MQKNNQYYNTNEELILQRFGNGVRLVKPKKDSDSFAVNSIRNLFRSSLNVYFLNKNSIIQNINENTVKNCGFYSVKNSIGKTVAIAAKKETAEFEISQDKKVISCNQIIMKEERYVRMNDSESLFLNTKFPLYSQDNKVIGIFGFSFLLDSDNVSVPLSEHLMFLLNAGLLSTTHSRSTQVKEIYDFLPGKLMGNFYLSKRQAEIIKYLILGKTAKQIALILGLSYRTIEYYLVNIKKKFNAHSKSELIEKIMLLS